MSAAKWVRCAVYTRKSSEEGLEQSFNSLDAQREACSAYILSQASEGWTEVKEHYDDGGLSGGTLERPALQRLLADVATGRVDIIVVYKVDRLTRSLLDFAKLVEAFDKAGTSFVSVTQSFNTTTSMGRLTLNMLLSFAQFEREVTAERIRDKIAASKARGMWMGGTPPVGYAPDGRSLSVVDADAEIVRYIFDNYLELGSVRGVAERLQAEGVWSPTRTRAKTGAQFGGVPFSRGQLYLILKNPLYVGEIHHHGRVHKALHQPIVDREVWERAQALLADNLQGKARRRLASSHLLAGKLIDGDGEPLIPVHATKGQKRYRYYVSRKLQHEPGSEGMRIPAAELEAAVCTRLADLFADSITLAATAQLVISPAGLAAYDSRCNGLRARIAARDTALTMPLINAVRILNGRIEIECDAAAVAAALQMDREVDASARLSIHSDVQLTRSGRAMRLVQDGGRTIAQAPDRSLIRLIVKARGWWSQLREGELDTKRLAEQSGVNPSYVTRVLRLAFLGCCQSNANRSPHDGVRAWRAGA